jgi:hypothetical protein
MIEVVNLIVSAFSIALPSIITALVFVVIGYIVGYLVKITLSRLLSKMGIDEWFEEQNLLAAIGNKEFSQVIGTIAKWYIFFIFLKQAVEIVNLVTLNQFLGFLVQYALLIIVAVGVVITGMIIGRYVRNAIEATQYSLRKFFGLILELVVVYIAMVMAIGIIGLPTYLLEMAFIIAFAGIVLAICLAMGIGFGLALKDESKMLINEMKKEVKKK